MLQKIKWFLKQLFPLTYTSYYKSGGQDILTIWKMWFGRSYKITNYFVSGIMSYEGDKRFN